METRSHKQVGRTWRRARAQPSRTARPPAEPPHSLSPSVFWRRSCLACSLVMRFLPSRYSFIFWTGGGQREHSQTPIKAENRRCALHTPFLKERLVSDPVSRAFLFYFFAARSIWAAADFHGGLVPYSVSSTLASGRSCLPEPLIHLFHLH